MHNDSHIASWVSRLLTPLQKQHRKSAMEMLQLCQDGSFGRLITIDWCFCEILRPYDEEAK